MEKSTDEKVQDLRVMKEDLEVVKQGLSGNFPNQDLELLAKVQLEALVKTLDVGINVHGMRREDRLRKERDSSRGQ